jgi:RNA polymerase sigma-70 factor (ECF subfamily)
MKINEVCLENSSLFILDKEEELIPGISRMKRNEELEAAGILFWELASPHKQKLYNFILKSLNYSEFADDVFQETVLRALKYFKSYKKEKSFNTWLYSIAHNEIKRHYKQNKKHTLITDIDKLRESKVNNSQELVKEIYRYAEQLKPKQREVFFLFYYSGFTISEVSRIVGLKTGNIKFILSQARSSIKKLIGE